MTPSRSSRFSRSCTALRDRPRWRPSAAVGIRAFARSREIKRRSVSSKLRFAIIPRRFAGLLALFSPFAGLRQALPTSYHARWLDPAHCPPPRARRTHEEILMTRKVLILGAGKIGGAIVDLLHGSGAYDIAVADSNGTFLKQAAGDRARAHEIDVGDSASLARVAAGQDAVLSALPFFLNP